VPNGTPQPIVDKLSATIAKVVTLPQVKKQFEEQGTEGASSTQAEMAKTAARGIYPSRRIGEKHRVSVD